MAELRPEVESDLSTLSEHWPQCEKRLRAELQRLTDENARLLQDEGDALTALQEEHEWQEEHARALKAEAERDALRTDRKTLWDFVQKVSPWSESNDMPWIDEVMCGISLLAQERDALRKRIEDAPVGVFDLCYNGHEPGFLGFPHAIENLPKGSMLGQRVRLVPVTATEDAQTGSRPASHRQDPAPQD